MFATKLLIPKASPALVALSAAAVQGWPRAVSKLHCRSLYGATGTHDAGQRSCREIAAISLVEHPSLCDRCD
jgi:hypothetical protein